MAMLLTRVDEKQARIDGEEVLTRHDRGLDNWGSIHTAWFPTKMWRLISAHPMSRPSLNFTLHRWELTVLTVISKYIINIWSKALSH
jgi:hypothetical protein